MTTPTQPSPTLSLATDKSTYNVGDPIQVTATYDDGTAVQVTLTINGTASDAAGNQVAAQVTAQVNTTQPGPMTVQITDSFGDSYAQDSNDNVSTAEFSSTVGTPPAA
jgi:hypothetical protein